MDRGFALLKSLIWLTKTNEKGEQSGWEPRGGQGETFAVGYPGTSLTKSPRPNATVAPPLPIFDIEKTWFFKILKSFFIFQNEGNGEEVSLI